jgi:hypothetical protein
VTDHIQVPLRFEPGHSADEGIAPLLDWLYLQGVQTVASCQGGLPTQHSTIPGEERTTLRPHVAYILFHNLQSLADALEAIRRVLVTAEEWSVLRRLEGGDSGGGRWEWKIALTSPTPGAVDADIRPLVRGAVHFPAADLVRLLELLPAAS